MFRTITRPAAAAASALSALALGGISPAFAWSDDPIARSSDLPAPRIAEQTRPDPSQLRPQIPDVRIDLVSVYPPGWVAAGAQVTVRMEGTPGGTAAFTIDGVGNEVKMTERRPGVYVGVWRVPQGRARMLPEASVQAILRFRGVPGPASNMGSGMKGVELSLGDRAGDR